VFWAAPGAEIPSADPDAATLSWPCLTTSLASFRATAPTGSRSQRHAGEVNGNSYQKELIESEQRPAASDRRPSTWRAASSASLDDDAYRVNPPVVGRRIVA
jgi:hypothetical protein